MNHELAEKLYKAGFPGIQCSEESPTPGYTYPNLSELIEACPNLYRIEKDYNVHKDAKGLDPYSWFAVTTVTWTGFGMKPDDIREEGKTPEEAIARLFIQLHEKNANKTN